MTAAWVGTAAAMNNPVYAAMPGQGLRHAACPPFRPPGGGPAAQHPVWSDAEDGGLGQQPQAAGFGEGVQAALSRGEQGPAGYGAEAGASGHQGTSVVSEQEPQAAVKRSARVQGRPPSYGFGDLSAAMGRKVGLQKPPPAVRLTRQRSEGALPDVQQQGAQHKAVSQPRGAAATGRGATQVAAVSEAESGQPPKPRPAASLSGMAMSVGRAAYGILGSATKMAMGSRLSQPQGDEAGQARQRDTAGPVHSGAGKCRRRPRVGMISGQ